MVQSFLLKIRLHSSSYDTQTDLQTEVNSIFLLISKEINRKESPTFRATGEGGGRRRWYVWPTWSSGRRRGAWLGAAKPSGA